MTSLQQGIVLFYALINFLLFLKGFYECKYKKNAYRLTPPLLYVGIFVWGDAVVFGLFWMIASIFTWLFQDWYLFLLVVSLFWVVRSIGETLYWFHQQFTPKEANGIDLLPFRSVFHNDSIWFILQTIWQCITVVSIICSIYFGKKWIDTRW